MFNSDWTKRTRKNLQPFVFKNRSNAVTLAVWYLFYLITSGILFNMAYMGIIYNAISLTSKYPTVPLEELAAYVYLDGAYNFCWAFLWLTSIGIFFILLMNLFAYLIDGQRNP